ncbi:MAG: pyrroloquinoline quinone biosynthesis protein PqqE [Meiothermus sp.]|nr:pyrroloquinoline quinone biosynthesis protein PqqE [Meiothermus sp.]
MNPNPTQPPMALVAEVTHRCPLQCLYCSNPLELSRHELDTAAWKRVLREANQIGILQVLISGGEPLLRPDLLEIVQSATDQELYTTLITSGIGLSTRRLEQLEAAGLGAVQLSVQSTDPQTARFVAGGDFLKKKMEVAQLIKQSSFPLVINVVLHRHNLGEVGPLLELAHDLGAERIELANTQYYGWALKNRDTLLPTREALEAAEKTVDEYRLRFGDMAIQWVVPDYYADYPKPCMGGWGSTHLIVSPDGKALPCPAAYVLPGLEFPSVERHSLEEIWYGSRLFNRFRGLDWLQEPCQSCDKRYQDFGGCRCQAFLLTGDAQATDPVCVLSPKHHLIEEARVVQLSVPEYRGFTEPQTTP